MISIFNISTLETNKKWPLVIIGIYLSMVILAILTNANSWSSGIDLKASYQAPFQEWSHLLGTDGLGRDVLAGILNGSLISFIIAGIGTIFPLVIGLFLGLISGYFGNSKLNFSWPTVLLSLGLFLLSCFYFYYSTAKLTGSILLIFSMAGLMYLDKTLFPKVKKVSLPIDGLILKVLEIFNSIPGIFAIILILSFFEKAGMINIIIALTLLRWSKFTRYVRAEVIKLKEREFILASEGLGLSSLELFTKHLIPNMIPTLKTVTIYSLVSCILLESTLSFLGMGLPIETVSWGSMLNDSREYFSAWWLAIFPGLAIFGIIVSLRNISSGWNLDSDEALL